LCRANYDALKELKWGKFVEMFLDHLKFDLNRSKETVSGYRKDLYHFGNCMINTHGIDITPKKIKPMDIWLFLRHITYEHNYAPRSKARNLASIKSFYKYLFNYEIVRKNPSVAIQWPDIPERTKPIYFSVEEFKRIIDAIDSDSKRGFSHSVIIHLLFLAGMRISEVLSLKMRDIDLRKKVIHVGKGNKSRIIPVGRALYPILREYKRQHRYKKANDWLFPSEKSTSGHITPQAVRLFIKKYCKRAGIRKEKMSPHVFRHGFATTLYQDQGVDLLRIANLLGHSSIRTTEIYSHTSEEHLRSAVDKIKV